MRKEGPTFVTTNPSLQSIRMPAFTKPVQLPETSIREIADYDLKLEEYHDLYDSSRDELKAAYEAAFAKPGSAAAGGGQDLPFKRVASQPGK